MVYPLSRVCINSPTEIASSPVVREDATEIKKLIGQGQYRGTFGSTRVDHASIPPSTGPWSATAPGAP